MGPLLQLLALLFDISASCCRICLQVKSLRQQLAEARAAAAAAPSEAAPAADGAAAAAAPAAVPALAEGPAAVTATAPHRVLLAEVAALRQRLADCAVESMTAASEPDQQQQDGGSSGELSWAYCR